MNIQYKIISIIVALVFLSGCSAVPFVDVVDNRNADGKTTGKVQVEQEQVELLSMAALAGCGIGFATDGLGGCIKLGALFAGLGVGLDAVKKYNNQPQVIVGGGTGGAGQNGNPLDSQLSDPAYCAQHPADCEPHNTEKARLQAAESARRACMIKNDTRSAANTTHSAQLGKLDCNACYKSTFRRWNPRWPNRNYRKCVR